MIVYIISYITHNVNTFLKKIDVARFSLNVYLSYGIQEQMTKGNNWPFAAALAVVLMVLTTLMIMLYRKITNAKESEGVG